MAMKHKRFSMLALWNACPMKCFTYLSGATPISSGRSLFLWGPMRHAPCALLRALCSMRYALCALPFAFNFYPFTFYFSPITMNHPPSAMRHAHPGFRYMTCAMVLVLSTAAVYALYPRFVSQIYYIKAGKFQKAGYLGLAVNTYKKAVLY